MIMRVKRSACSSALACLACSRNYIGQLTCYYRLGRFCPELTPETKVGSGVSGRVCHQRCFKMATLARPMFVKTTPLARLISIPQVPKLGFFKRIIATFSVYQIQPPKFELRQSKAEGKNVQNSTPLARLGDRKSIPLKAAHPKVPLLQNNPPPLQGDLKSHFYPRSFAGTLQFQTVYKSNLA